MGRKQAKTKARTAQADHKIQPRKHGKFHRPDFLHRMIMNPLVSFCLGIICILLGELIGVTWGVDSFSAFIKWRGM